MKFGEAIFGAALALLAVSTAAHAATNVASISEGASFVFATTAVDLAAESGTLMTMQSDPISSSPTPWLGDGDTRYIFGTSDPLQGYEIKLAGEDSLSSLSASFSLSDRPVSEFFVFTSTDGMLFTPLFGTQTSSAVGDVGTDTVTVAGDLLAQYIFYTFGPASTQYSDGGSGIINVTAISAAPEPSTWALMMAGVGMIGAALRFGRRRSSPATAWI